MKQATPYNFIVTMVDFTDAHGVMMIDKLNIAFWRNSDGSARFHSHGDFTSEAISGPYKIIQIRDKGGRIIHEFAATESPKEES